MLPFGIKGRRRPRLCFCHSHGCLVLALYWIYCVFIPQNMWNIGPILSISVRVCVYSRDCDGLGSSYSSRSSQGQRPPSAVSDLVPHILAEGFQSHKIHPVDSYWRTNGIVRAYRNARLLLLLCSHPLQLATVFKLLGWERGQKLMSDFKKKQDSPQGYY